MFLCCFSLQQVQKSGSKVHIVVYVLKSLFNL